MKQVKGLFISLFVGLLTVSFASPAIYVEDRGFDYSIDNLSNYVHDTENDQFIDVPTYVYFESPTVDGALRLHFTTDNTFNTDIPVMFVTVPEASDGLADIVELDLTGLNANSPKGIDIAVADMSLEEVMDCYLTKFQDLNYSVTKLDEKSYTISQLNSSYEVSFIEASDAITISIKGI